MLPYSTPPELLIHARGDTADRIRSFDWSPTPLRGMHHWPSSLLLTLNLMLDAGSPMLLWWGQERIQFYNDAFIKIFDGTSISLSSHALGRRGEECWADLWPAIYPYVEDVTQTGKAAYLENQVLPHYLDGRLEQIHLNSSYSPVREEGGQIGGVLWVCQETTSTNERLQRYEAQQRLHETITSATPDLIYVFDLQYRFTYANKALLEMWGKTWETAIGKGLRENGYEEWHARMHEREIDYIVATRESFRGEVSFPHATLGRRIYDYILNPVMDENGKNVIAVAGTTRDITDIKNAEKALAESEARFRTMAEGSGILIAMADESSKAVYFSKAWVELTGQPMEIMLDYGWLKVLHPDDQQRYTETYLNAFKEHVPFTCEFRVQTKEGIYQWLLANSLPRVLADGSFAGYITACMDITEQKLNEQRKNDFIGMVSHELRTPLTSMSGYLQLLKLRAKDTEDVFTENIAEKAGKQIFRMMRLINGFLNISRFESADFQIDKKFFDMAQLLREQEEEIKIMYNTHQFVFAPAEKIIVWADRDKVSQVISNLINNAVKYSPSHSFIYVTCISEGGKAIIGIRDQGIGVRDEERTKLFERYYRVNNDYARSVSGFGIGLYLCQEIIKRHEGEISVESEFGKGSIFSFSIPLAQAEDVKNRKF